MKSFYEWRHRVYRTIGRRGAIMILCANIWILIGIATFLEVSVAPPNADSVFHLYLDPTIRGTAWIITGLFAGFSAWSKKSNYLAIGGLMIMPSLVVASYTLAWFIHLWPGLPNGDSGGWYRAAIYLNLVALVLLAATEKDGGDSGWG